MSISSLFFIIACIGSYRLGAFNERHPGRTWEFLRASTIWLWHSLNK